MIRNILLMAALLVSTVAATSQHQVKQSFTNVTEVEIEGIFCQVNIDAANQDQVDFLLAERQLQAGNQFAGQTDSCWTDFRGFDQQIDISTLS